MSARAVVLAHAHDAGAAAVASRLSSRLGARVLTVVRPEILGLAQWSQRLGSSAEVETRLKLPSGEVIDSSTIACLFNRLQYIQSPRFSTATPKDRDFALAEQQALVASWLHALGDRAVNATGPRAQARGPMTPRGWLALAIGCGIPVVRSVGATSAGAIGATNLGERIRLRTEWPGGTSGPVPADVEWAASDQVEVETVLVAGDRVVGSLAGKLGDRCRELGRRSGCSLLELRFVRIHGDHALREVDPLPPLVQEAAVAATVELLLQTAARFGTAR